MQRPTPKTPTPTLSYLLGSRPIIHLGPTFPNNTQPRPQTFYADLAMKPAPCTPDPPFWSPSSIPQEHSRPNGYSGWVEYDTVVSGWTPLQGSAVSAFIDLLDARGQRSNLGGELKVHNGSPHCPIYVGWERSGAPPYAVAPQGDREIDVPIYRSPNDNRPSQIPVKIWFWIGPNMY